MFHVPCLEAARAPPVAFRSQPSNSPLSRRARLASTPACVPHDTCFGIRDFGTWLIKRSLSVCLSECKTQEDRSHKVWLSPLGTVPPGEGEGRTKCSVRVS